MIPLGWLAFGYVLELLVAVIAIRLARSRPYHAPAARYLLALALTDIARGALLVGWLGAAGPHAGLVRCLYNLDQVLTLVEPVGLAWVSLAVFWPAQVVWRERLFAVAIFVAGAITTSYPLLRDALYQTVLLVVWAAAQATAWTAMIVWRHRNSKEWPTLTQRLVPSYASAQACIQLGPVLAGGIFKHWEAGFGACVLLQLVGIVQQALWIGAPVDQAPVLPKSARIRRAFTVASGAAVAAASGRRPSRRG